ncbi:MAG: tyrosine-type recombinase/integrase [Phycisphaerales bacterium]|nr:tyrosine-type recombinase/integrase [Phycisphaerales bacterium]
MMAKRPAYCDGIGLFRGAKSFTVWIKVRLPHGGIYNGRSVPPGGSIEHKAGNRASWTWQQLEAERDRLQGLADRNEPLEQAQVETFAAYAAGWLERRKPTLKGYGISNGHVKTALNPTFGKIALNAITVADVNRWIGKQSATLAPATVKRQLNTFNSIMNEAVKEGCIDANPSKHARRVKAGDERQRFVTGEEWETILSTCDRIEQEQEERRELMPQEKRGWLRHFVTWAYNSGMRRAEILALEWDNIREVGKEHTVVEVLNTKNGKSRYVTCTAEMRNILAALRDLPREDGDVRLFPLSLTTLKRALTALWKETGLNDVRLHDLRRSHATILVGKGFDLRTIAGRLGNTTAVLEKHYAVDRGDKDAAEAFG